MNYLYLFIINICKTVSKYGIFIINSYLFRS